MATASVLDGFEAQVDADPRRDAIRRLRTSTPGSVSFGQLDLWSDAIAAALIRLRGPRPEPVPLAICAPDLMLAAALGALKAGKFYVAVNPMHPPAHVRRVLDELAAPLLLCDRAGEVAASFSRTAHSVEEILAAGSPDGRLGLRFDADRLAYVLYTSGSTGSPRGVAQSRRDMLHNVKRHRALAVGADDCMTLLSADGFVASVSNPYVALLGGAALAPYSFRDAGVEGMVDWMQELGVTVLYAFPSFLRQLGARADIGLHDGLRLAYLGGETVLPADLAAARRLFPTAALSVGLNSSETGLTCLCLIPPGEALPDPVPVGRPVLDVRVAVLGEQGTPLEPGEIGEIEIRSRYVRPRYWDRGTVRGNGTSAHTFRTGDLGRIDEQGVVYHVGRIDGVVKVRGFRVAIAEVEAVISALPEVAEVAVFAAGEDPAEVELAACIVGQSLDASSVRSAVARELPPALVPTRVWVLDALPRTPNGKLDRTALAQIARTTQAGASDSRPDSDRAPVSTSAPAGVLSPAQVERRIAAIWSAELEKANVSVEEDFFALGGTSIAAVTVVAQISSEFGVMVPLAALFATPTVSALATTVIELQRQLTPGLGDALRPPRVQAARASDFHRVRELIAQQTHLRARPLAERRAQYEQAEQAFGANHAGELVDAGGCAAEWVLAQRSSAQPVLVYFHGGGYCLGSARSHRHLAARIGHAAGVAVLSVDYRRAPEFAFPAAVEDAHAATSWLLERSTGPVVLAGDSAGGGLVVASMIALRDAGLRLPAAGVCLSPWVDLTCRADAYKRLAARDPLLSSAELKWMAHSYLRDASPHLPLASPVFAELAGLPPLLIQVGTEEILLDDARMLALAARAEGVKVTLEEWPGMIHAWHWYFPILEEGRRAIGACATFIRRHSTGELNRGRSARNGQARSMPASLIQEAHLLIAPSTSGRGYLSWVYQLNGQLDTAALASAIDDVVRRHEILRSRFEYGGGRTQVVVEPFTPGVLRLVNLADQTKPEGLAAALADAESVYRSLSPRVDPRMRATLYTIGPKTSVLAMFVAEALVDSDSGSLLSAAISHAYAEHAGSQLPAGLPEVSEACHLDYLDSLQPDPAAIEGAQLYWERQARHAPPSDGWPLTAPGSDSDGSSFAFSVTPAEWAHRTTHARALGITPYVFVLTALQLTLARTGGMTRLLAHTVVSRRPASARGMIGNFHSLARIDLRLDPHADFKAAAMVTAAAVAEAIEHCVVPAPLTASGSLITLPSGDPLPDVRFYMFSNHEGPVFAGVRRRRFRLHGAPRAPLTFSCISGPQGRHDFVLSSTTASRALLERLALTFGSLAEQGE